MPDGTYLRAKIEDKIYLFDEKIVSKVVLADTLRIFPSPFGQNLHYLFIYENNLVPLFSLNKATIKKDSIVLILIRLLDTAGILIDNFIDFVKINDMDLDNSVIVNEKFSQRAIKITDKDCYFFDEIALFKGEE